MRKSNQNIAAVVSRWIGLIVLALAVGAGQGYGQTPASATGRTASVQHGSNIAKAGFKNEDDIRDKLNNWREDADARDWLAAMNYRLSDIVSVMAVKPHGEKADVVVRIRVKAMNFTAEAQRRRDNSVGPEFVEGISIKLVSSPNGFNQIDKRWLANYAKKWNMPTDVVAALRLYLGEVPPNKPSRDKRRMFLNELESPQQKAVMDFFSANKERIVSDLIQGDGGGAAGWMMVAYKATDKPRWAIRSSADAVRFFSEGKVEMTRAGNLKIGRITMQRKGGDGGRETANMLQFKINPSLLVN